MANEGAGDPLVDLRADLAGRGELKPAALADCLQADQARRWRAGRGVPAEAYLDVHHRVRGDPELIVDLILGEVLLRRERGERPDPAEYARRFPELAEVLAAHLQLDRDLEAEGETLGGGDAAGPGPSTIGASEATTDFTPPAAEGAVHPSPPPVGGLACGAAVRYFGDYEIRRELGRGGMGVVYEARQVSLNRPVALKMIRAGVLADDADLRRFQNEAEAIALLDHPGMVPIHEVGQHDGQHYFSMKLVPGGSLAPLLDRYGADPRAAATLAAEAAEAVAHAHARGVLHRDLKPANILVDAEGRPCITDFGLAKRVAADVESTASGAIAGTPAYMAPEQATGRRGAITTATDVYGLGAVLYALLTGRAPFGGDSVVETIDAVRNAPPEPPRRLNAAVPRDLETICLKCLEKDPRRRYPTAQALADDLRAWLESRPIAARRVGPAERAWLWCRRRPAIAALSALAMAATVGGTAAVIVVQARSNAALRAANRRVEQRYDLAVEAIGRFHTGVSEDFLLKEEKFKDLRDRLLRSAAEFYGKLSALLDGEADLDSRRALARSNYELANLTGQVGRPEDALAAHRAVLSVREAVAARPGAVPGDAVEVGRSLTAIARLLQATGRTEEALTVHRRCEALLAARSGADPAAVAVLAVCRRDMAGILHATGKDAEALSAYGLARSAQQAMASAPGATPEARSDLAWTIHGIARLLSETGRPAEAEAEYRQAIAIYQELADDNPAVTPFRNRLAGSHDRLGTLLSETGRSMEAEAEYRAAIAIQRKLADDNPAVSEFRHGLTASHNSLGLLLTNTGRPVAAEAEYRRALPIQQKLADDSPAVSEFRRRLADIHHNLGYLLSGTGRPVEAEAEHRAAMGIFQKLADDNPAVTDFRRRLTASHNSLGLLLSETGRPAEAEAEHRQAIAILQKLADDNPAVSEFHSRLAASHLNLGNLLSETGRPSKVEAEYRQAIAIFQKLADDHPTVTGFREGLALSHGNLGMILSGTGRTAEAEAEHRQAIALYQKLVDDNPGTPDYRNGLANSHTGLGDASRRRGRAAEARDRYDRAIALLEALVAQHPENTGYRSTLAASRRSRGLARRDLGDRAGAAEDARRSLALFDGLPARSGDLWYETACAHAALADLAGRDDPGPAGERAASEADTAMALLARAADMGFRDPAAYRTEAALDGLRDREDFGLLMMDLAMPADPFAR